MPAQPLERLAWEEVVATLLEKATQVEFQIERLQAEHAALSTAPHIGLSDEQAVPLERYAAEARAGIGNAGPGDSRDIFGLLQLRGTVSLDDTGIRLARANRFRILWTGIIALQSEDRKLTNIQTIVVSDGSGTGLQMVKAD